MVATEYPDDTFTVSSTAGGWCLRCDDCPGETHEVLCDRFGKVSLEKTHLLGPKHTNAVLYRLQQANQFPKDTRSNNHRLEQFKSTNPGGPIHRTSWIDMVECPSAEPMVQKSMLVLKRPVLHIILPEYVISTYRSPAHLSSPAAVGDWHENLNSKVQTLLSKVVETFEVSRWDFWFAFGCSIVSSRSALSTIQKLQRGRPCTTFQELVYETRFTKGIRNVLNTFANRDIQRAARVICPTAFPDEDKPKMGRIFFPGSGALSENTHIPGLNLSLHTLGNVVDLTQDSDPAANSMIQRDNYQIPERNNEYYSQFDNEEIPVSVTMSLESSIVSSQNISTPVSHSTETRLPPPPHVPRMHDETLGTSTELEQTSMVLDTTSGSDGEHVVSLVNSASVIEEPMTVNPQLAGNPTMVEEPCDETTNDPLEVFTPVVASHNTTRKHQRSPSSDSDAELKHFRKKQEKRRQLVENNEAIKQVKAEVQSISEQHGKLLDEFNGHQSQIENIKIHTVNQFKQVALRFEGFARSAKEIEPLRQEMQAFRNTHQNLRLDIDATKARNENQNVSHLKSLVDVRESIVTTNKSLADHDAELGQIRQSVTATQTQVGVLEGNLGRFDASYESLNERVTLCMETNQKIVSVSTTTTDQVATIEQKLAQNTQNLESLTKITSSAKVRVGDLEKFYDNKIFTLENEKILKLENHLVSVKEFQEKISAKSTALADKIEALEQSPRQEVEILKEIQGLKTELLELKSLIEKNDEKARKSLDELLSSRLQYSKTLVAVKRDIDEVLAVSEARHQENEKTIKDLLKLHGILRDNNTLGDARVEFLKGEIETLSAKDAALSDRLEVLEKSSGKPIEDLDDVPSAAVMSMFKKLENQWDATNQALADQKAVSNQHEIENAKLKATVIELQAKQAAHEASTTKSNMNRVEQCQYNKIDVQKNVDKERRARETDSGKMHHRIADVEEDVEKIKGAENGNQKGKKGRG